MRALTLLLLASATVAQARPLADAPVIWNEDDRRGVAVPEERDPNLSWTGVDETFIRPLDRLARPGRWIRRIGTAFGDDHVPRAANVNALDEVPNSSWFTNRIGLYPISPEEAARGPGDGRGPDRSGPWTVTRAKTEGVTPGFTVKDAKGGTFFIKFDPPGYPGTSTTAGVVSGRIFHAAGYNVPDETVVRFRRSDLVLGSGVKLKQPDGSRRDMTDEDLDRILNAVEHDPSGEWQAIASKLLEGKPVGPFDYKGRRPDDPNDHIDHEHRRELRGLRVFCAWLVHFDTKQQNSLDMYVGEAGQGYVRHHLLDFASTLGAGASGAFPAYGWEYSLDPPAIAGRALALGFHEDAWRKLRTPEGLSEVGYFENDLFDPLESKPLVPNPAFANLSDPDGYWAAKIISAFSDEHLRAIVAAGGYRDPKAAEYIARVLGQRRDKIARHWFDRLAPLDFFTVDGTTVRWHDLGAERSVYPGSMAKYRVRVAGATADETIAAPTEWISVPGDDLAIDLSLPAVKSALQGAAGSHPFVMVECAVDRGAGFSAPVRAFVAPGSGRVVAVER